MLRRATEEETSAFLLVERTIRRARPRETKRGLRSIVVPGGTIERTSLGRLRLRPDALTSTDDVENGPGTRPLESGEVFSWTRIRTMIDVLAPVVDPEGNLLSMKIGSRVLRRLALGGVIALAPEGTPPFQKGPMRPAIETKPAPRRPRPDVRRSEDEARLLALIDRFLREDDPLPWIRPRARFGRHPVGASQWSGHRGNSSPLSGGRFGRNKWGKCPICRAPVVRGRFNPRIPHTRLRAGSGSIQDLRGGYLSSLRETYIVQEPVSVIEPSEPHADPADDLAGEEAF